MSASDERLDPATHAGILAEKVIPDSGLHEASSHTKPKVIIWQGSPGRERVD